MFTPVFGNDVRAAAFSTLDIDEVTVFKCSGIDSAEVLFLNEFMEDVFDRLIAEGDAVMKSEVPIDCFGFERQAMLVHEAENCDSALVDAHIMHFRRGAHNNVEAPRFLIDRLFILFLTHKFAK